VVSRFLLKNEQAGTMGSLPNVQVESVHFANPADVTKLQN